MRGYKFPTNTEQDSRLLAWCGNFLNDEQNSDLDVLLR
jgi:hypothetical protein